MRKHLCEFLHRGLYAAGGGPVVLAVIYGILGRTGAVTALSPAEVCTGVLSITLMAFIAGGITMIYQVEQLPLISAVLIHGGVLYLDYLLIYLLNDWIPQDFTGIGIFTAVFSAGYGLIWLCIWLSIRSKTKKLNRKLHS